MNPRNSSTSSSSGASGSDTRIRDTAWVLVWTVLSLATLDLGVGLAFPRHDLQGSASFFNRGLSNEGKLRTALSAPAGESPLLLDYGWIGAWDDLPTRAVGAKRLLVASYGMSFSHRVSERLPELDPNIELRLVGGPGAPLNHAFACYQEDRARHEADVVILGVLASSLPMLRSMNQLTWAEIPAIYTYPRYRVDEGELVAIKPVVSTLDELRSAAHDPDMWHKFVEQMRNHDGYFSELSFSESALDHSIVGRVLRRAWGQRHSRNTNAQAYQAGTFDPESETVRVARAILSQFADTARADGRLPIVVLFDNTSLDDLDQALSALLESEEIPFVSSHEIAPATDPSNFLPDRHFTPDVDKRLAAAVLELIRAHLPGRRTDVRRGN